MDPTSPFTRPHSRAGLDDLRAASLLQHRDGGDSACVALPEEEGAELDADAVMQAKLDALPPWRQRLTVRGLIVGAGE